MPIKTKSKIKKNIDQLIDDNFMDKNKFSMTIENIVKDSNQTLNYIDAIVDFCESKDLEVESVVKLIAPSLKQKIKAEATRLNYIKKTNQRCTTYLICLLLKFIVLMLQLKLILQQIDMIIFVMETT